MLKGNPLLYTRTSRCAHWNGGSATVRYQWLASWDWPTLDLCQSVECGIIPLKAGVVCSLISNRAAVLGDAWVTKQCDDTACLPPPRQDQPSLASPSAHARVYLSGLAVRSTAVFSLVPAGPLAQNLSSILLQTTVFLHPSFVCFNPACLCFCSSKSGLPAW